MADKFCAYCGAKISESASFCPVCGAKVNNEAAQNQNTGYQNTGYQNAGYQNMGYQGGYQSMGQQTFVQQQPEKTGLIESYKKFWKNYANFNGRCRRADYWYAYLANIIVVTVVTMFLGIIGGVVAGISGDEETLMAVMMGVYGLMMIYVLAMIIPSLSIVVRRLHDIGKSGAYYLMCFIPFVGGIILLVYTFMDSEPGDNMYGPNPKGIQKPMYAQGNNGYRPM